MGLFYRGWNSFGPIKLSGDAHGVKQIRFQTYKINWILWSAPGWGGTDTVDLPGPIDFRHNDNN